MHILILYILIFIFLGSKQEGKILKCIVVSILLIIFVIIIPEYFNFAAFSRINLLHVYIDIDLQCGDET
jgi:hypothetical protein